MWEHVPLACALISLATSESTQELLPEKETFHRVKRLRGSPQLPFFPDTARKFKRTIRWITSSRLHKLSISHLRNAPYPRDAHWSRPSEHKYKALNVFRCFHSCRGNDKQCSDNCQGQFPHSCLSAATWRTWTSLSVRFFLLFSVYKQNILADQSTERRKKKKRKKSYMLELCSGV